MHLHESARTQDIRFDILTKHVKRGVLERLRSGFCLFNGAGGGNVGFFLLDHRDLCLDSFVKFVGGTESVEFLVFFKCGPASGVQMWSSGVLRPCHALLHSGQ